LGRDVLPSPVHGTFSLDDVPLLSFDVDHDRVRDTAPATDGGDLGLGKIDDAPAEQLLGVPPDNVLDLALALEGESIPKLVETRATSRSQAAVERTALSGAVMPSSF
jgi:hypothetical protein